MHHRHPYIPLAGASSYSFTSSHQDTPKMPSIPSPLPVTSFPSLSTLFDAPNVSPRPSSYREQRAVRCRSLPHAVSSAEPDVVARNYASFVLALTGEDDAVFTLHHSGRDDTGEDEEEAAATQRAVYTTRQDPSDRADDLNSLHTCAATIINQAEGYVTTDFALVLGHAPSEALKVR